MFRYPQYAYPYVAPEPKTSFEIFEAVDKNIGRLIEKFNTENSPLHAVFHSLFRLIM